MGTVKKIYRGVFWIGYVLVFIVAGIPLKNDLHRQMVDLLSFKFHLDQLLHALVYFLICLYCFAGDKYGLKLFEKNNVSGYMIAIVILAIMTEAVQLFVPSRTFNFFDMLANVIGIFAGLVITIPFLGTREAENSQ